jgi:hypothetical protein
MARANATSRLNERNSIREDLRGAHHTIESIDSRVDPDPGVEAR